MNPQPVLIAGQWRTAQASGTFQADNPTTEQPLPDAYPISSWADVDAALTAAVAAAEGLVQTAPETIAAFLDAYADRIEAEGDVLVAMAHAETALPVKPRLADVELPRTTGQLREAARARANRSWMLATIDSRLNIRSCHAPIGPVLVFGPNNFPFAFNGISGGDFAAAIAAGNPVIAKANSSHPGTTRLLAIAAHESALAAGLPPATVQLIYRTSHADGERAVADPRSGATGYTGSRAAGLALKAAADRAGKPIYLELSSINPVVVLPAALRSRGQQIAAEFTASCLMGTGQFCTNPGLVVLLRGTETNAWIEALQQGFRARRSARCCRGAWRSHWRRTSANSSRPARGCSSAEPPAEARASASPIRCWQSTAHDYLPAPRSFRPRPSATLRCWSSLPTRPRRPKSSTRSRAT